MKTTRIDPLELVECVRAACIQTVLAGYEDAAMGSLCHEGSWDAAISGIENLELSTVIQGNNTGLEYLCL